MVVGIESLTNQRDLNPARYNKIKNAVNRWLNLQFPFTKTRYQSMCMHKRKELSWDGVHMTEDGVEQLFNRVIELAAAYFESLN